MEDTYSSCSSTTTIPRWNYHVFMSFRGEDTRKGFAKQLLTRLEEKGMTTFRDDKDLERGLAVGHELFTAIEQSMVAIVLLSPNYASSTWCLDELEKIVECHYKIGLKVMPIFYGVDPSNTRDQTESTFHFQEAFQKHEEKYGRGSEKVQNWREALREVVRFPDSWDSIHYGNEEELMESIAQHIQKKLYLKLPSSTERLVGIDSRVREVIWLLSMQMKHAVEFIGIWGLAGIGKTTIASVLFEAVRDDFEVSFFIPNIRETCDRRGLHYILKDLLSCLNIRNDNISSLYDIRHRLNTKKVLLVLDDVSERMQLEIFCVKEWFGPGSRLIITTRDVHLLRSHGVHRIYQVKELAPNEAFHLFCMRAFGTSQPPERFLDLSRRAVDYAEGLPVTLIVLGSHLHGRTISEWESFLHKVGHVPDQKTVAVLRDTFEGLNYATKDIFLDITFFFTGMRKDKVIKILQNCGYLCPAIEIQVLIEKSLITINQWHQLEIQRSVQEMCRDIVRGESGPRHRTWLWHEKDIHYVLSKNKGTGAIKGITLNSKNQLNGYEAGWSPEAFSKTTNLKYLKLCNVNLHFGLNSIPHSLEVIHWEGCSLKTLPLTVRQYRFVDIQLPHSKIDQLWHGKKFLPRLKYLDLSFSKNLKHLPDFSEVPELETLVLEGCTSLTKVHLSLVHHKKITLLDLKDCTSLKALPSKLEMSSLKKLILTGCSKLKSVPEFGESMKALSVLSFEGTAIKELHSSIGCLVSLVILDLKNCKHLVSLPDTIDGLSSLKELFLCGCSKLKNGPNFGESMKHLSMLSLKGTAITRLDSSLDSLVDLAVLNLSDCKQLVCLPDTIYVLRFLRNLDTSGCSKLGGLPSSVLSLGSLTILNLSFCNLSEESIPHDFCDLQSLKFLDLSGNSFVGVPINIHELSILEILKLNHCKKLQLLPELPPSIKQLEASNCDSLETSMFNPYTLFASLGQYGPKVLDPFDMMVTGSKIPSWFEHQEDGGYVSVPSICSQNEIVGIALCFLLVSYAKPCHHYTVKTECSSIGHEVEVERHLPKMNPGCPHLYILFLPNRAKHNHFGLFVKEKSCSLSAGENSFWNQLDLAVVRNGCRVLYKQGFANGSSSPASYVFMNIEGDDTCNGFIDHLCDSLENKGITTFRDNSKDLARGHVISQERLKAIEQSMFAITILTPNYASSTRCLDELQKIVECYNNHGLAIIPIFYGVDPSDVRHQRASYKEAFEKHQKDFRQDSYKVERWRDALRETASHSGWDFKEWDEAVLVESIAQHVHNKLVPKLSCHAENLVGISSKLEEVIKLIGLNDQVRFIGIWGTGGIGKTTIAKAVYETIEGIFDFKCFLANVREVSETNGLVQVQRDLLSCLNINCGDFHDSDGGKEIVQNFLCNKKVLIVLDDVSDKSQLESLAGKQDWFGRGSRVIITTRDVGLLREHGVHKTYEVEGLVEKEALQLFCLKAFKKDQPQERYLDLCKRAVDFAGGLPLALEVLGSYLFQKRVYTGTGVLQTKRGVDTEIQDILKICCENLDTWEKNIFLDIACFYKGMNRDKVIDILEHCGYYSARVGIETLIQRSLVTLDRVNKKLGMHDLVQQVGRIIASQEYPNDPGRRSRLWSPEDQCSQVSL